VDDIVPEAEVLVQSQVQLSSSVDTLRKQYHQLEVQLKGTSGLKVTPKVKETIQTMLQMVEDEIEPAITEAHTADQQVLEAKMQAVSDLNDVTKSAQGLMTTRADQLRNEIKSHNTYADDWEGSAEDYVKAITDYENAVSHKTTTCCQAQDAGVNFIAYTPAYYTCDYKESTDSECVAAAETELKSHIKKDYDEGDAEYERLKEECSKAGTAMSTASSSMSTSKSQCSIDQGNAQAKASIVNSELPQLKGDWGEAQKTYEGKYSTRKGEYETSEQTVKSQEKDRHNEW